MTIATATDASTTSATGELDVITRPVLANRRRGIWRVRGNETRGSKPLATGHQAVKRLETSPDALLLVRVEPSGILVRDEERHRLVIALDRDPFARRCRIEELAKMAGYESLVNMTPAR